MKVGIVIQARKGSTRLPGKVVMPFYNDDSILSIIVHRILEIYPKEQVILATTESEVDDEVASVGNDLGVHVYRGSEEDVLDRFVQVINKYELSGVVRVCADNPFLDVSSFAQFIEWNEESQADYTSYGIADGHPTIKTHFGLWAEYVSASALVKASEMTEEKLYIEHVTNFIYGNPDVFEVEIKSLPHNWSKEKNIRFTLDSKEDFDLLADMYCHFIESKIEMTPKNLISYVKKNKNIENQMANQVARWEK
jgi:spore coat polysaccharide biosynthesis protein SpsF